MTRVAITHYPANRRGEETIWTDMPQVPAVGDSLSLGDPEIATQCVRHVRWCATPAMDGALAWHAEINIGVRA